MTLMIQKINFKSFLRETLRSQLLSLGCGQDKTFLRTSSDQTTELTTTTFFFFLVWVQCLVAITPTLTIESNIEKLIIRTELN